MNIERVSAGTCTRPFPLYDGLADALVRAHQGECGEGDAAVAHVLATCAGYAYADGPAGVFHPIKTAACLSISDNVW